jgi:FixJ family two-component response regulator
VESQGHTIAIVDDGPSERASLSRMLSLRGYRVEPFSSAADFFRAAPASEASCVIVDIRRGNTSGLELARHLAADGFKFPVIFIGNSDDDLIQMRCHEVSCVAYLQKPYSENRLIDAIATAIGSKTKRA